MFGKSKHEEPVTEEAAAYGWTENRLSFLHQQLSVETPQFLIELAGLRQSFGRKRYSFEGASVGNKLVGVSRAFRARVGGTFEVGPDDEFGGLRLASEQKVDDGPYTPFFYFHLNCGSRLHEFRLQRALHLTLSLRHPVTLILNLQTVSDPEGKIAKLRKDGGIDSLPLHSFYFITESGEGEYDF